MRQRRVAKWLLSVSFGVVMVAADVATAAPQALVIRAAMLRADAAFGSATGGLALTGRLDDTETGTFASALLATQIALRVSDGGSFAVNVVPSGCREGAGGSVRCVDGGRNVLLVAKRAGPLQYRLRVRVRNLSEAETGHLRPRGPVRVTIEQLETADRIDTVSDCFLPGVSMLLCRDLGRPNLIFLVSDDQRWDTMADMPRVQRLLIDHGINFTNAFVTTPLCCPSRASMLTGQYAHRHGILSNVLPEGGAPKFVGADASTLATWVQRVGYRTGMYGKYLTGYSVQCPPYTASCYVPPGWDEWHAFFNQGFFNYGLINDGAVVRYGNAPADYSTDVLTALAVEFIMSSVGQPFFLHLGYAAPHTDGSALPIPAPRHGGTFAGDPPWRPQSYNEADISDKPPWFLNLPSADDILFGFFTRAAWMDVMRQYQRESLLAVDESVEALVAALEASGQLENTVIVFTSDNGYLWGEHRIFYTKDFPYEESVRVPLIIRYPRLVTAPRSEPGFALNIDLAPTLADLAGATPTTIVDGVSLRPLLMGNSAGWRSDFLLEWWNFAPPGGLPSYTAVRGEQFKYCAYERPPVSERELYDLTADPYELDNRAADPAYADVAATLQARLQTYLP